MRRVLQSTNDNDRWPLISPQFSQNLVSDVEQVVEPLRDDEGAGLPLPLKQCVGRHGRPHPDVVDPRRVQRPVARVRHASLFLKYRIIRRSI